MHLGVAPAGFDSLTLAGLARHARAFRLGSAGNFWIWQVHASSRQILNRNWCFSAVHDVLVCWNMLEQASGQDHEWSQMSWHCSVFEFWRHETWPQVALHSTSNCGEEKWCHGTMFEELQTHVNYIVSSCRKPEGWSVWYWLMLNWMLTKLLFRTNRQSQTCNLGHRNLSVTSSDSVSSYQLSAHDSGTDGTGLS